MVSPEFPRNSRMICRPIRTKLWRSITAHYQYQGNNDDCFYHGYAYEQQYECTDRVKHGSPA